MAKARRSLSSLPLASKATESTDTEPPKAQLRNVIVRLAPQDHRRLRQMALDRDATVQSLVETAIKSLLRGAKG